jgi:hypothetical protein
MMGCSSQEGQTIKKQGDVSRKRRLVGSEAKCRWYARRRAERFAKRA